MIDVYIAEHIKMCADPHIYPAEREKYILSAKNSEVRSQRFSVWKLLERAVEDVYGKGLEDFAFTRTEDGKWSCDKFCFSLSHTQTIACVALSDSAVGVDAEDVLLFKSRCESSPNFARSLAEKLRGDGDVTEGNSGLIKEWTARESAFKRGGYECVFAARPQDVTTVWAEIEHFIVAVCGDGADSARFFISPVLGDSYGKGKELTLNLQYKLV